MDVHLQIESSSVDDPAKPDSLLKALRNSSIGATFNRFNLVIARIAQKKAELDFCFILFEAIFRSCLNMVKVAKACQLVVIKKTRAIDTRRPSLKNECPGMPFQEIIGSSSVHCPDSASEK